MNSLFLSVQSYIGKGAPYSGSSHRSCEEVITNDQKLDDFFGLFEPSDMCRDDADLTYCDGRVSDQGLYTSYLDYHQIFNDLQKRELRSFCDIGCGIGRGLVLSNFENRKVETYGVEIVSERVKVLKKALQRFPGNAKVLESCLVSNPNSIPEADAYFLYIPDGRLLYHVMKQLMSYAKRRKIYIYAVESHGSAIEEIRLWGARKIDSSMRCSAYREFPEIRILELSSLSHSRSQFFNLYEQVHRQEGHVEIEEQRAGKSIKWIAQLAGAQFYFINSEPYLELLYPNRTIKLNECSFVINPEFEVDLYKIAKNQGKRLIVSPSIYFE